MDARSSSPIEMKNNEVIVMVAMLQDKAAFQYVSGESKIHPTITALAAVQ